MLLGVNLKVISMKDLAGLILSEIKAAERAGLSVMDLVERLDISPKKITSALTALMSEGMIMQKQEVGNETYIAKDVLTEESELIGLTDMNGCPCFHCLKITKCGVRQPDSPIFCRGLEEWVGTDIQ